MFNRLVKGVERLYKGEEKFEHDERLHEWKKKLRNAMTRVNLTTFDDRERIYSGTHTVDKNVNSRDMPRKGANNVRNVTYEMIESQVDTTIPMPSVKAKRKGFDFLAKMVEDSHSADVLSELPIQRINDEMERITPMQGQSYVLVSWNPDYTHREFVGELQLTHIHPKQLIPQPGVFDIQEMDYFFILSSVTREFIKRRFDVELDDNEQEEYPQVNRLDYEEHTVTHTSPGFDSEKVTLITCWYRDDDNEIGRICWINDTILEDSPKFFHRRQSVCKECGREHPQGIEECEECGGKTKVEASDYETIAEDKELIPLFYKRDRRVVVRDPITSQPIGVEEIEEEVIEERIISAGEEIAYYTPKRYPIAMRINTPKSFSLGGMSDVDVVRDQQDSIKKVLSKIEAKIINSGSYITKLKQTKLDLSNLDNQILEITNQAEKAAIDVFTLQPTITQDMAYYEDQYRAIQSTLGISDSYQGKKDTTATSGKAKEIQVQRAAGRLLSKVLNKHDFYRQLYEIMFEFKLAFYDEIRPYIRQDDDGTDDWGDFDKYQFLLQDAAGEWFYCTDFIFNSDSGQGIPNDKLWLYDQILGLYSAQAIDLIMLWTILEQLKFPSAGSILAQLKARQDAVEEAEGQLEEEVMSQGVDSMAGGGGSPGGNLGALMQGLSPEQQQEIEAILANMSPEGVEAFMNLPPDQMEAAMIQAIEG